MLIRRDAFLTAGGFDPQIFLYFEDDDLALRAWAERRPIVYVRAAVVRDARNAASLGDRSADRIKYQSYGWSLLYLGAKHFGKPGWPAFVAMVMKLAVYVIFVRRRRIGRQWGRMKGAWDYLRGRKAPFRPEN